MLLINKTKKFLANDHFNNGKSKSKNGTFWLMPPPYIIGWLAKNPLPIFLRLITDE